MSDLSKKQCAPCRGGVPPLKGPELDALFAQLDGGWSVVDELISRRSIGPTIFGRRWTSPTGLVKWGVGALIQRGGRAVAGMLTIATAGGS